MTINNSENLGTTIGTSPSIVQVDVNGTQSAPVTDYNHPLYLHSTNVSGISLISLQLTGLENYSLWNSVQDVWEDMKERFNKVDGSRSFSLHQEIVRLTQGTTSVATYFTKLKELWVELEALVPLPGYKYDKLREFVAYLQKHKLYQFLMGLNDHYLQARSQIFLNKPSICLIISDKSQKTLGTVSSSVGLLGTMPTLDSIAMYSKTGYQGQKLRKTNNLYCDYCKIRFHTRENCYKLKRYPQESNFKRKGGPGGSSAAYNVFSEEASDQLTQLDNQGNNKANRVHYTETPAQMAQMNQLPEQITQTGACAFTQSQYEQIVQLLNQSQLQSANSHTAS
ncbi:uncharacterized protein [Nicotiana tomentosiformis]|uniref:uncharacterized protein n=1 Tax=Nicotiana tomentosiformis TaxID=4098 RepID=UPI00388C9BAD